MIKALAGPYGQMEFMPTGGIGKENIEITCRMTKFLPAAEPGIWFRLIMTREGNFERSGADRGSGSRDAGF